MVGPASPPVSPSSLGSETQAAPGFAHACNPLLWNLSLPLLQHGLSPVRLQVAGAALALPGTLPQHVAHGELNTFAWCVKTRRVVLPAST